jgi:FkbM family methyltransferase
MKVSKFFGQFNPPVDKVIYERYFIDYSNGISIECGAFDGLTENCTKFFEDNLNWKTINIEPLNHIYKKLILNRPNSINKNIALSDKIGSANIRVYNINNYGIDNNNASINHTENHRKQLEIMSNNKYIEQPINTITYKQLIQDLKINQLDLFVLDVEGYEFNVIEGMIGEDILPDLFVIEHGHSEVGVFDEILNKLNSKYKLDYVSFVNSFYIKIGSRLDK